MTELEKAARQALKCLDWMADSDAPAPDVSFAKCAADLRRALQSGTDVEQQPADEPFCYHDGRDIVEKQFANDSDVFPLYTRPQPADEPVGYLYSWIHSSATGKPDETYTSFAESLDEAERHESHFNIRPVYTRPQQAAPAIPDLTHDQWDAWQDKWGVILERDALDDLRAMLAAAPEQKGNQS